MSRSSRYFEQYLYAPLEAPVRERSFCAYTVVCQLFILNPLTQANRLFNNVEATSKVPRDVVDDIPPASSTCDCYSILRVWVWVDRTIPTPMSIVFAMIYERKCERIPFVSFHFCLLWWLVLTCEERQTKRHTHRFVFYLSRKFRKAKLVDYSKSEKNLFEIILELIYVQCMFQLSFIYDHTSMIDLVQRWFISNVAHETIGMVVCALWVLNAE